MVLDIMGNSGTAPRWRCAYIDALTSQIEYGYESYKFHTVEPRHDWDESHNV